MTEEKLNSVNHSKKAAPSNTPESSAAHHRKIRKQHAQEKAQDYVEAISQLIEDKGEARATELANLLGVSHVTVIRTVQRLQKEGWVTSEPYRSIFLTPKGEKLAKTSRERHRIIINFLETLGVSSAIAAADAEGIEHHVSPETLGAFERFISREKPKSDSK